MSIPAVQSLLQKHTSKSFVDNVHFLSFNHDLNTNTLNTGSLDVPAIVLFFPQQKEEGHFCLIVPHQESSEKIVAYDSLGLLPEAYNFLPSNTLIDAPCRLKQIQDQSTDTCGRWTIWFLLCHIFQSDSIMPRGWSPTIKSTANRMHVYPNRIDIDLWNADPHLLKNDKDIVTYLY